MDANVQYNFDELSKKQLNTATTTTPVSTTLPSSLVTTTTATTTATTTQPSNEEMDPALRNIAMSLVVQPAQYQVFYYSYFI